MLLRVSSGWPQKRADVSGSVHRMVKAEGKGFPEERCLYDNALKSEELDEKGQVCLKRVCLAFLCFGKG